MDLHPTSLAVNAKSQALSGESQLRQFGAFLEAHDRLLANHSSDDCRSALHSAGGGGHPTATQCAPVRLSVGCHEQLAHHQLANTNNTVLNKIVCTFAELCTEVRRLRSTAEQQQLRFLFADELVVGADEQEAEAQADEQQQQHELLVRISEQLELLCEIQQLVQRCVLVGAETLRQMGAFFGSSTALVATTSTATNPAVQLQVVFHRLADLATTLLAFDHILQRSNLHEHWPHFTKAIDTLHDHHSHFAAPAGHPAYSEHQVDGLRNVLADLEQQLFSGDLFGTFVIGLQAVRSAMSTAAVNVTAQHWDAYVRAQLYRLERPQGAVNLANAQLLLCNDFGEAADVIRCTVMAVLLHAALGRLDAAIATRVYDLNTRHCGLTLLEHFPWLPEDLIARYVRFAPKSTAAKAMHRYVTDAKRLRLETWRSKFSEARNTQLAQLLCARTLTWQMQMRAAAVNAASSTEQTGVQLAARASLLLDGLRLMGEISYLAKLITNQHILAGAVMTKTTLANVCRLLEHYRTARTVYDELGEFCAAATQTATQHLAYQSLAVIQQTIQRKFASHLPLVAAATYSERDIDQLSALQLAERCLFGPATEQRLLVARLALSIADPTAVFSGEHLEILSDRLGRLETMLDMQRLLQRRPDTTFVYWHQAVLVGFVRQVQQQALAPEKASAVAQFPTPVNSVHFLARLNGAVLPGKAAASYRIDVDHLLRGDYLARLCSHIENNLRLSIHTYMHDTPSAAATAAAAASNASSLVANAAFRRLEAAASAQLLRLCSVRPLPLADHHFVFRNHVEHYLSRTFYNLTAVALPDGRTYSEMRSFARIKYGLRLVEDQLPAETIEQGLDLLDVMRFMGDFCAKFVYDMNSQVFLQAQSGNQFLNTLSVAHVVNSLRTHGLGIVNTAINGGYKQLCQLMPLVSRFLYADKVRSALRKCARHFAEQRQRTAAAGFSFELARQLVKTAPRLCAADQSFGAFLATITQIGNIMGYVRLVRSAAIRCVCRAGVFLPAGAASGAELAMAARAAELRLPAATAEAAWNVRVNVATLCKDFVHRPDYFRSFLQAFNAVIADPKNGHLGQFYLVLPALSVMFVDGLLRSKEYKHKGSGAGSGDATAEQRLVFTDDGFAMGVAYVLVVLGQVEAFWTLDWFGEVGRKYATELAELEAKRARLGSSFEDEKLRQTLLLTGRRITALADEFELLRCNLRCALRFFQ